MNHHLARPYTFDRVVRMVIGLTVAVLLVLILNRLRNVLLPFAIGWLLAYLFYPIVEFFQYKLKLKSRVLAITCALLSVLIVIGGLMWIVVPLIGKEFERFSHLITLYTQNFNVDSFLPIAWQNKIRDFFAQVDIQALFSDQTYKDMFQNIAPKMWSIVNSSLSFIFGLVVVVIVLLYFIFILLDYEKLNAGFVNIIPTKYRPLIVEIFTDLKNGMNKYFRGQFLIAFIDGILYAVGFSIIGLPLGIVLGILMGVMNLIPYLQTVGIIPAILLGLLKAAETGQSVWGILLAVAIVLIIVQGFEQVVLVPKIMGKAMGLNPAIILLSLSVWGALMGLLGMIIALPMTTLIISYYKRFVLEEEALPTIETVLPPQTEEIPNQNPHDIDV